jgi:hypothetical protein
MLVGLPLRHPAGMDAGIFTDSRRNSGIRRLTLARLPLGKMPHHPTSAAPVCLCQTIKPQSFGATRCKVDDGYRNTFDSLHRHYWTKRKFGHALYLLPQADKLQNNPLHISIFSSHEPSTDTLAPIRTPLQFSLLLSSTLDIFALRTARDSTAVSGDFGLLHAVDERLAAYGFETNTGVKFVVIVDMRGRRIDASLAGAGAKGASAVGLREGEMKPVCFLSKMRLSGC